MSFFIKLTANRPGYADFEITRWKGDTNIQIAIQRNQDGYYFAEGNLWKSEPVWHEIQHHQTENGVIVGQLTPAIIDSLVEQGSNVTLQMSARSGEFIDRGTLKLPSNLMSSSAGGSNVRCDDIRALTDEPTQTVETEEPVIEPELTEVEQEQVNDQEPVQVSPTEITLSQKSNKTLFIIVGLLLLAVLAGALGWFLLNKGDDISKEVDTCEIQQGVNELTFLQGCLKTNPTTERLLEVITAAKKANACGIAQRLYANKAQGGNAQIAFAYAKEYDPQFAQAEGCFKADKETAIYWYETGLSIEPNNNDAKARLDELKK